MKNNNNSHNNKPTTYCEKKKRSRSAVLGDGSSTRSNLRRDGSSIRSRGESEDDFQPFNEVAARFKHKKRAGPTILRKGRYVHTTHNYIHDIRVEVCV